MKRQAILIISIAVVFVLLLVGYFVFVRPVTADTGEVEETTTPETEKGEKLGTSNRYFIFDNLSRSDVQSIYVNNEYGEFTFETDDDGEFHIKGYESVVIDSELFSSLVSVTTYTLSKTKIKSTITDEKLEEYGLKDPQAYWIVTAKNGKQFKVYVGDKLLTGGGFYCKFEGRNSVYVLDKTIANTILVPIETYVTPVLVAGISQNDYYTVDKFTVFSGTDPVFRIRLVDPKDQINKDALAENIMDYPTAYYPNSSLYYDIIYGKFMGSCMATKCYKLDAKDDDIVAIGMDVPAHTVAFEYNDTNYILMFSELQDDNTYYVVSNIYPDVIGIVEADDFEWLEYPLVKWIDEYVFQQYITEVSEVTIETDNVEAEFNLKHYTDDSGNASFVLTANGVEKNADATANFRQYYKSLLAIAIYDYVKDDEYCSLSEDEIKALAFDESKAYLKFTYTKNNGDSQTLCFYKYSSRHSLVTIDGVGEFYVLTDLIQKIENDTIKVLADETVTAYEKN